MSRIGIMLAIDLVYGMDDSCYEYDEESIFGEGRRAVVIKALKKIEEKDSDSYQYQLP
jgi:hypothetical protein